eukprot:scaffold644_cov32-Attheya_sp.AAC.4
MAKIHWTFSRIGILQCYGPTHADVPKCQEAANDDDESDESPDIRFHKSHHNSHIYTWYRMVLPHRSIQWMVYSSVTIDRKRTELNDQKVTFATIATSVQYRKSIG